MSEWVDGCFRMCVCVCVARNFVSVGGSFLVCVCWGYRMPPCWLVYCVMGSGGNDDSGWSERKKISMVCSLFDSLQFSTTAFYRICVLARGSEKEEEEREKRTSKQARLATYTASHATPNFRESW